MSTPQTNFENNNNRLANYAKNIDNILGYVLLYSVIIFTTISALLGGYPFYLIIYILNKTKEIKATKENEIAEANEIADDKWNMDYENDPLIKAQKKAKEIAKKVKETAKRAAMAYATKGMSETNRQTNGAAGGASEGGDEMSGANKMDMASMFKGMK